MHSAKAPAAPAHDEGECEGEGEGEREGEREGEGEGDAPTPASEDETPEVTVLTHKQQRAAEKRVRTWANPIWDDLARRADIRPQILARLILWLPEEELLAMREQPIMKCFQFGAKREAIHDLQTKLYTPYNSLDIRANEIIPTGSMTNIRKRLSEVHQPDGKMARLVLDKAPDYRTEKKGGPPGLHVNPLLQWHVRALCGRELAVLRAPLVLADHKKVLPQPQP